MTKPWLLALPLLAGAAPASAAILDAQFSGPVLSQTAAGLAVGSRISGEFIYNTDAAAYVLFTIAGDTASGNAGSSATITPDGFTALYQSQLSPVQQGGTVNNTLTVDLEGLNPFISPVLPGSAVALLTDPARLAADLDTANSTFGFTRSNANGTNVVRVTADLTSFSVAVPEPASVALFAAACLMVGVRLRRA